MVVDFDEILYGHVAIQEHLYSIQYNPVALLQNG
jgi:hypothetical protein